MSTENINKTETENRVYPFFMCKELVTIDSKGVRNYTTELVKEFETLEQAYEYMDSLKEREGANSSVDAENMDCVWAACVSIDGWEYRIYENAEDPYQGLDMFGFPVGAYETEVA